VTTRTIRVLVLSSLIATLTPLGIMAQSPMNFAIPFGFTIGQKTLLAGTIVSLSYCLTFCSFRAPTTSRCPSSRTARNRGTLRTKSR